MGSENGNGHGYGTTCRKEINLAVQQGLVLIVVVGDPFAFRSSEGRHRQNQERWGRWILSALESVQTLKLYIKKEAIETQNHF